MVINVSTHSDLVLFLAPHSLINADFCVAGSLIAYGALLGKVSPVQLMVVTLFGVTLFAVEEYIILDLLHVSLTKHNHPTGNFITVRKVRIFLQTLFSNISFVLLIPTVQRCWWLHGHSRLRRVLWFGHLLGPLPTKPTPKQTPQWIGLPL